LTRTEFRSSITVERHAKEIAAASSQWSAIDRDAGADDAPPAKHFAGASKNVDPG
jgi:hypothetical protein